MDVRPVRDDIEARVLDLFTEIGVTLHASLSLNV
jgi:hypothetical protein